MLAETYIEPQGHGYATFAVIELGRYAEGNLALLIG